MQGQRHSVLGAGGVPIGLLTAGEGPPLLVVHGGMSQIEAWAPAWERLSRRWQVTAMDRRGRGTSGDAASYAIGDEYDDIAAVARALADRSGGSIDVLAHSYGATCTLGAAARGAPFRRVVLYEPPARQTVSAEWVARASKLASDGRAGQAMFSFLTEIVGLSAEQASELAARPMSYDVLAIVANTLAREGMALLATDVRASGRSVKYPVLLLLGETSPPWARSITHDLADAIPHTEIALLPGLGHEAIDAAPNLVVKAAARFLCDRTTRFP